MAQSAAERGRGRGLNRDEMIAPLADIFSVSSFLQLIEPFHMQWDSNGLILYFPRLSSEKSLDSCRPDRRNRNARGAIGQHPCIGAQLSLRGGVR